MKAGSRKGPSVLCSIYLGPRASWSDHGFKVAGTSPHFIGDSCFLLFYFETSICTLHGA